jgi:8-oxo-dGTP pyrophosphatase MutT (NUDIX family)
MSKIKMGCVAVIEYPPNSDSFVLVEETKKHKRARLNLAGGGINYLKNEGRWESPVECVKREATEETGLKVKPVGYLDSFFYGRAGQLHLAFACVAIGGKMQASEKHPTVESYPFDVIEETLVPGGYLRSNRVISLIQQYREEEGSFLPLDHLHTGDLDRMPKFHPPNLGAVPALAA